MYTFVKFNGAWWLKISSVEEYLKSNDFENEKWNKAITELFDPDVGTIKHYTSELAILICQRAANNRNSIVDEILNIQQEISECKIKAIIDYGSIYINKKGGYCFGIKDIDGKIEKEDLIYPDVTEHSISIKKFPYGSHYYAYIDGKEVKDEFGNIKWNTPERAGEVAKQYIEKGE